MSLRPSIRFLLRSIPTRVFPPLLYDQAGSLKRRRDRKKINPADAQNLSCLLSSQSPFRKTEKPLGSRRTRAKEFCDLARERVHATRFSSSFFLARDRRTSPSSSSSAFLRSPRLDDDDGKINRFPPKTHKRTHPKSATTKGRKKKQKKKTTKTNTSIIIIIVEKRKNVPSRRLGFSTLSPVSRSRVSCARNSFASSGRRLSRRRLQRRT